VNWLSDNYKWLFDGVAGAAFVAFAVYLAQRLSKRKLEPADEGASLTAQGSNVANSPVAHGTRITQNVNSPTTVHLNLSDAAPSSKPSQGSLEIVFLWDRKPYLEEMPKGVITGRVLLDRRYRVGVRTTSSATIPNTRVILENCEPSEHHGIHLAHTLQLMDAQQGIGEFSVRPGDVPSAFVDVVYDELLGDRLRGEGFGLCYSSPVASFAIPRGTYILTLRVESDGMQSRKRFRVFQDSTTQMLTMREDIQNGGVGSAGRLAGATAQECNETDQDRNFTSSPVAGPEVVLEYEYGVRNPLTVCNLSGGTSYSVQIEDIRLDDRCTVAFEGISHIGEGSSVRVLPNVRDFCIRPDTDEGNRIKDDFAHVLEATYQTWGHDFDPVRLPLVIHYADRNGSRYQTQCEIEFDAFRKTAKTKFEPPRKIA
jgi:hypothetical protein